jgi:rhomboid protease GluP
MPVNSLNPLRLIREAPVTLLCLTACGVLFLATSQPGQTEAEHREALNRWGAVIERPFVKIVDQKTLHVEQDLRGPIALWEGELWRIPLCAFHHVDFWHLFVNGLSAIYLGRLLESCWGSRRLLLFLPCSATIPILVEFLFGNDAFGFSGVIAAMFGVLCVLRYRREELQEVFPVEVVHLGGAMLAFGVLSTALDLVPVANLAHMTGFFYGALAGSVSTGLPWGAGMARLIRFAVILLAAVGLWFVAHPLWNGSYHWYLAMRTDDPNLRYAELQHAVRLDPQAIGAWRRLAGEEWRRGEALAAWKTLLTGLSENPSNSQLLAAARRAWRKVVLSPGRPAAEQAIREVFGELASTWETQFREDQLNLELPGATFPPAVAETDPVERFPLDQRVDLSLPDVAASNSRDITPYRSPPEGDAVEGRRM